MARLKRCIADNCAHVAQSGAITLVAQNIPMPWRSEASRAGIDLNIALVEALLKDGLLRWGKKNRRGRGAIRRDAENILALLDFTYTEHHALEAELPEDWLGLPWITATEDA